MEESSHYSIRENEKFGRYLVASKDLDGGELIFKDTPFVIGPKPDSPPLCLGCYCPVENIVCSYCGWPICSDKCEASPQHAGECAVFSSVKVRFHPVDDWTASSPQLDCITPLRLLLAKEKYPKRWQQELEVMETHTEVRRQRPTWEADQINIVNFLIDYCKLGNRFNKELVEKVCGILEVNSVEVPSHGGISVRAIYPRLAIAAHSCVPNIVHTIVQSSYQVLIRAAVPIKAGSDLHLCYTYALSPTIIRREHLLESKFFHCDCPRCADPTELGTHLSTFICNKCTEGFILSTNPLDMYAPWTCTDQNCGVVTSSEAIRHILDIVQTEIEQLDSLRLESQAIAQRENLIQKYKTVFHPRHSIMLSNKHTLAQLYGLPGRLNIDNVPDDILKKKLEYCKEVLNTLDVITPGETRMRGMILYELHSSLMIMAKREFSIGLITEQNLKDRLQESLDCLENAATILLREDPQSPEGITGHVAQHTTKQLKATLKLSN